MILEQFKVTCFNGKEHGMSVSLYTLHSLVNFLFLGICMYGAEGFQGHTDTFEMKNGKIFGK